MVATLYSVSRRAGVRCSRERSEVLLWFLLPKRPVSSNSGRLTLRIWRRHSRCRRRGASISPAGFLGHGWAGVRGPATKGSVLSGYRWPTHGWQCGLSGELSVESCGKRKEAGVLERAISPGWGSYAGVTDGKPLAPPSPVLVDSEACEA